MANVAAINCDDESNKPFCGSMGVQGFPTLKIVKPSKQSSRKGHAEDYQGSRTAKGITDAVMDKIFNHVMRLKTEDDYEKFQKKTPDRPKGLIFSEKGLIPAFVKTLAIDFLGTIDFGYVRSGDKELVKRFSVDGFPSVLLLPGDGSEPLKFAGQVDKPALVEFFSQITPPHPSAPSSSKTSSQTSKSSKTQPVVEFETLDVDSYPEVPKESPDPDVSSDKPKPVQVPLRESPKITHLDTANALQKACLHTKSTTCILAAVPSADDSDATTPVGTLAKSLADIAHKHAQRGAKIFPFYTVDNANAEFKALADGLELVDSPGPQVLAVNAKRGWWTGLGGDDFGAATVEAWVDGIRLGDFAKKKIPEGLVRELEAEPAAASAEAEGVEVEEPVETESDHSEL